MNPDNGEIFRSELEDEELIKKGFIELTEEEYSELKPLPRNVRKNTMRNKPCPCKSGKKFKKCCWSKYTTRVKLGMLS